MPAPGGPQWVGVGDLFSIGIGPSSSHTVGPMRAGADFAVRALAAARTGGAETADSDAPGRIARLAIHLYGSLAATGAGHGTPGAVLLGLEGDEPETTDVDARDGRLDRIRSRGALQLGGAGGVEVSFRGEDDIVGHPLTRLSRHSNGLRLEAWDAAGAVLCSETYYSIGGGFVERELADGVTEPAGASRATGPVPHPFSSGAELLACCRETGLSVSDAMRADELVFVTPQELSERIRGIADTMLACIDRGSHRGGVLPGGLGVRRRAAALRAELEAADDPFSPELATDWLGVAAMAVNEENAIGGRVVTAPTNGAAGIIPAVLFTLLHVQRPEWGRDPRRRAETIERYLLAAAAVGRLYTQRASISGAEVGCQGEVGSACSMAAGGLAEALGGTPAQVENAAEIAMEHNLGLTCDPVGGLVQVPCIERNAMGANTATVAARMALHGDGTHVVSLDEVIETMRQTGLDMSDKYKETSRGGLAVNVVEC